mmetsp:Transcript_34453/g.41569  ORF Transcript_34453/g.41569 Transcript_34453/m.41569 type:complete len:312 (+) Transcript_34453:636-1571(+)
MCLGCFNTHEPPPTNTHPVVGLSTSLYFVYLHMLKTVTASTVNLMVRGRIHECALDQSKVQAFCMAKAPDISPPPPPTTVRFLIKQSAVFCLLLSSFPHRPFKTLNSISISLGVISNRHRSNSTVSAPPLVFNTSCWPNSTTNDSIFPAPTTMEEDLVHNLHSLVSFEDFIVLLEVRPISSTTILPIIDDLRCAFFLCGEPGTSLSPSPSKGTNSITLASNSLFRSTAKLLASALAIAHSVKAPTLVSSSSTLRRSPRRLRAFTEISWARVLAVTALLVTRSISSCISEREAAFSFMAALAALACCFMALN